MPKKFECRKGRISIGEAASSEDERSPKLTNLSAIAFLLEMYESTINHILQSENTIFQRVWTDQRGEK